LPSTGRPYQACGFMQKTSDINVVETRALPSPAALLAEIPKQEAQAEFVARARQDIRRRSSRMTAASC
jgi:hypothetical protein